MRLEAIAIALRRRAPWEALDLGQAMLREWRSPALRAWAASYFPVALVLFVVLWDRPGIAAAVLWWIKPAFDRVLLFVYGRAAFGAPPTVREVWRELPRILGRTQLAAGLTLHRFSMARSFFLPVWQLEQLQGREARARRRVLGARTRAYAVWLTFFLANMSTVLGMSVILLAEFLRPVDAASLFGWESWSQGEIQPWRSVLLNGAFMLADTLIEPLYVAAGFSLYLNRRTELEGWDIELAFRRMAAQAQPQPASGSARAAAAVLACCAAFALALPDPAAAADAKLTTGTSAAPRQSEAKRVIGEILDDRVFGRTKQSLEWRYNRQTAEDEELSPWLRRFKGVVDFLAESLRLLTYVALALAAGLLIYLFYRHRDPLRRTGGKRALPPATLFGLDVRPESLPQDVTAAARTQIEAGCHAAALSLLYRGALVALIHRAQVEFRSGDTEDECRRRVAGRIDSEGMDYFERLLRAWRLTAYANTPPPARELQRLCEGWSAHFALQEFAP